MVVGYLKAEVMTFNQKTPFVETGSSATSTCLSGRISDASVLSQAFS